MLNSADLRLSTRAAGSALCIACSLLLALPVPAAADAAGRALAQRVYDRPDGDDMSSRALMTLTGNRGSQRQRELYTLALDKGNAQRWSLIRFTAPADIDGTGLLTLDYPGDESDQWIYLPALDRVRRISSQRKGGRFVGSDLYYEDLRDREVTMDRHTLAGQEKVGGIACDVLVSEPVDPDNSVYAKRVSWIHPKTLLPLRVDFYAKGHETPSKRLKVGKIKKIQGYWTILESTMQDLREGSETRIQVRDVQYDQGLPERLFSSQALADPAQERGYLP